MAVDPRGALVGRDRGLAQLGERLTRALAGQRQFVFLSGEAGIGKTTMLDAFLAGAASDPDLLIALFPKRPMKIIGLKNAKGGT